MKRNLLKPLILSALNVLCGAALIAQNGHKCGTDAASEKLYQKHPGLRQAQDAYNATLANAVKNGPTIKAAETVYTIPVVFHIIHTYGAENISDSQIQSQMVTLNNDFRKLNTDISAIVDNTPFDTLAADCKIQFALAQIDPNGNCTNGIDRIYSHKTNNADDFSKLNQWPREKYLNVWVVKSIGDAGVAGYAYYPGAVNGPLYPLDGIIILHNYIGSTGTSSPFNSRALTHEIGHWLNLQHPWGNNNDPEVACGDDLVSDTPLTKGHTSCDLYTPYCTNGPIVDLFNFDDVVTTSGTTDPTAVPTDTGVVFSPFTASGVGTNPTMAGSFSFDSWNSGAIDMDTTYAAMLGSINTAKYYEFTVTPGYGYSSTLTALTFNVQRSATGPRSFAIRSSIGGFASNLAPTVTPASPLLKTRGSEFFIQFDTTVSLTGGRINLPSATYKNLIAPVTFRIYAWNAEDTTGTFSVDNFSVAGTTGVIENTQNFMDYSYCSVMFTQGQKARMRNSLESPISGRNNLWTAANLAATGTDGSGVPCKPLPDFYANRTLVCAGGTVTFNRNIMNATGAAPTLLWKFEGAATPTSTAASPTVTYPTPGNYKVTLVATNSAGTDSVVKDDYIRVRSTSAVYFAPAIEDFDPATNFYYYWDVDNLDAGTPSWSLAAGDGYGSGNAARMAAYNNYKEDVDNLVSASFDLTGITSPVVTLRCAAATKATSTADMNDVLKIYVSTDCGATWTPRKTITASSPTPGAGFVSAGYHPEYYVPASDSEWRTHSFTPGTSGPNVRFKFEYTTGSLSNNLYIDDINVNGVLGIESATLDQESVSVYPNPAKGSATVAFTLAAPTEVTVSLTDILGKEIMTKAPGTLQPGEHRIMLDAEGLDLQNGIYFVRVTTAEGTVTRKIVFTR